MFLLLVLLFLLVALVASLLSCFSWLLYLVLAVLCMSFNARQICGKGSELFQWQLRGEVQENCLANGEANHFPECFVVFFDAPHSQPKQINQQNKSRGPKQAQIINYHKHLLGLKHPHPPLPELGDWSGGTAGGSPAVPWRSVLKPWNCVTSHGLGRSVLARSQKWDGKGTSLRKIDWRKIMRKCISSWGSPI